MEKEFFKSQSRLTVLKQVPILNKPNTRQKLPHMERQEDIQSKNTESDAEKPSRSWGGV